MQKVRLALGIASVVVFGSVALSSVNATPLYLVAYKMRHMADVSTHKCAVCHVGRPAEAKWSDYGTAFGDALGAKNVKDLDAILKAIDAADKATAKKD